MNEAEAESWLTDRPKKCPTCRSYDPSVRKIVRYLGGDELECEARWHATSDTDKKDTQDKDPAAKLADALDENTGISQAFAMQLAEMLVQYYGEAE